MSFENILNEIEQKLLDYYQISTEVAAHDYLYAKKLEMPQVSASERGALYLLEDQEKDELFLGLYFSAEIKELVSAHNPLIQLTSKNLDAFCVVAEELSHFHLICQRAQAKRQVSLLELEYQGEIDKFLLAAIVLAKQYGHGHQNQLFHLLFNNYSWISPSQHYRQANKAAAKFWSTVKQQQFCIQNNKQFQFFMQDNYHRNFGQKICPLKI